MDNVDIARTLERVADLLEIQGANPFRIRAYRNAARVLEGYGEPLAKLVESDADLTEIEGVGKDMASYIRELVEDGRLSVLEELEAEVPPGVVEITRIQGVGPKKAARLWKELGITTPEELAAAAREGEVAALKGFGKKSEAAILEGLQHLSAEGDRILLSEADRQADAVREHLSKIRGITKLEVAGSLRRRKETVGDLDVLVVAKSPKDVMEHVTTWSEVRRVLGAGDTRASVVLKSGLQIDVRVVPARSFGAALVYFTGSKAHNIKLRKQALDEGLHVSEYGVFREEKAPKGGAKKPSEGEYVAGKSEKDVYAALGLPWVPPELREDRGELEAARKGSLPALFELAHLRGDLHMHTRWSDGKDTVADMLKGCVERGLAYAAITDHSRSLTVASGLDEKKLRKQWEEMGRLKVPKGFQLLRGIEVDILEDGSLDLPDELLGELDLVVASLHSHLDLPAGKQTKRLTRALANTSVHVLAHPTARLLGKRPPIKAAMDEVLAAAKEHGVAIELNAQPMRLDAPDTLLIRAKELGVPIVINSDAHSRRGLEGLRYGVDQARRAGLEKGDVLNTLPFSKLLTALKMGSRA